MSYRIEQDFQYVGNDYWHWGAWIEGEDAELDKVTEVVWILHPSFKRQRVVSRQRSDKFRLQTAGWGIFLLRAEIVLADGDRELLKHNLRLEYPSTSEPGASAQSTASALPERPWTVFLSYSTQDTKVAAILRNGLAKEGLEVVDQTNLAPGVPFSETLQRLMERADCVVCIVAEDEISPLVNDEIKAAIASAKPTWVLLGSSASSANVPSGARTIALDLNGLDPSVIAKTVRSG
jgi:hypothetical protein